MLAPQSAAGSPVISERSPQRTRASARRFAFGIASMFHQSPGEKALKFLKQVEKKPGMYGGHVTVSFIHVRNGGFTGHGLTAYMSSPQFGWSTRHTRTAMK